MQARNTSKADSVVKALVNRYPRAHSLPVRIDRDGIIGLLNAVPDEAMVGEVSLLSILEDMAPETGFPAYEHAMLASVDDCLKLIFPIVDLEIEVIQQIHFAIPRLAAELIRTPDLPFLEQPSVLTILDHLAQGMIGWTSRLGRAGERLYEQMAGVIAKLQTDGVDIAALDADVAAYFKNDSARIDRLEERLVASETGLLRLHESNNLAATMINDAMQGKKLTEDMVQFLKGPWYDSMRLIVLTRGAESVDWARASKTTQTIVWSYQPVENEDPQAVARGKQRLYGVIEQLPAEIRDLLVSLEHNSDAVDDALEMIEKEHISIMSGRPLDYVAFEPLKREERVPAHAGQSDQLLEMVNAFEPGQWFVYESDDLLVRMKLVLKLNDIRQLLFTNRNGIKIMQPGFDEFADYLSTGVVRVLETNAIFTSTFKSYYEDLIDEHAHERQIAARQAAIDRQEQEREAGRKREREAAVALARKEEDEARARIEQENQKRLEQARQAAEQADAGTISIIEQQVADLALGAWLGLPGADGQMEQCKLAVKIPARDKLIFVNRRGMKIGEYSSAQLVQLLVAGQGEIQDEGVEFEDTLEQVVTRLRQDRNKSFDDLTGQ